MKPLAFCCALLAIGCVSGPDEVSRRPADDDPVDQGSGGRPAAAGSGPGGTGGGSPASVGEGGAGGSAAPPEADAGAPSVDAALPPAGSTVPGLAFTLPPDSAPDAPLPACRREIAVSSDATLASALGSVAPGDCLLLEDGAYRALKLGARGTPEAPIVLRARNRLGARFTQGQLVLERAAHLVLEGLVFALPSTMKLIDCQACRLTRNRFALTVSDDWLLVYGAESRGNRFDRNDFGPKPTPGPVLVFGQGTTMSREDRVDRNHFHDTGPPAVNEKEAVRIGWSGVSKEDGRATVELNLFESCDGDPEIVSVKTNRNVVRYNTVRTSTGVLSLRHGDASFLYGNVILGGGKSLPCTDRSGAAATCHTGGIRLYGKQHVVVNNYVEGTTGTGHTAPIAIDGGDGTALSDHAQVVGAQIVANTFVDNASGIEIGKNYSIAPKDVVVAFNLVRAPAGKLVQIFKPQATVTIVGNLVWAGGSTEVGASLRADAAAVVNPGLVRIGELFALAPGSPAIDRASALGPMLPVDVDGQPRARPDVGADEQGAALGPRRPLTAKDVGPNAP